MNKRWYDKTWDDYLFWQSGDKKTLKRIVWFIVLMAIYLKFCLAKGTMNSSNFWDGKFEPFSI